MMIVSIEIWPGGDKLRRKEIHTMSVANISDLSEISNYMYSIDACTPNIIKGHHRSDGAWELVRKILNQEHNE